MTTEQALEMVRAFLARVEMDTDVLNRDRSDVLQAVDDALEALSSSETAPAYKREYEAYVELEGRLCPEDVGFEEFIGVLRKKLASPSAPSGWQQRIAAMDPWSIGETSETSCFFCGAPARGDDHEPDCLWQNAKDALPPAPPAGGLTLEQLAAQQGVKPIRDIAELQADVLPDGVDIDAELEAIRHPPPTCSGGAHVFLQPEKHPACKCGAWKMRDVEGMPLSALPPAPEGSPAASAKCRRCGGSGYLEVGTGKGGSGCPECLGTGTRADASPTPRKPFRLDVSKEWCERIAQLEDGHDVSAGGEPAPEGSPAKEARDLNRCAVCAWPVRERLEEGCVRGNCSMRPHPTRFYDAERAEREYGIAVGLVGGNHVFLFDKPDGLVGEADASPAKETPHDA